MIDQWLDIAISSRIVKDQGTHYSKGSAVVWVINRHKEEGVRETREIGAYKRGGENDESRSREETDEIQKVISRDQEKTE